jgi:hypothetical protein
MSERALRRSALVCALLAALAVWPAGTAHAYHDEETRSLEDSAYQLRSREWLLGPFELGVGLWRFQLSTRTLPWILGAALGKFMPNLNADFLVLDMKGLTLSARAGFYYVNSNKLVETEDPLNVYVVPMTLALSWRINDAHTVTLSARYVRVASDTATASEEDLKVNKATLADNAQLQASWEWRLTKISALVFAFRYLLYQGDPIVTTSVQLDDSTSAEVDASLDAKNLKNGAAGSASAVFSWKHFNLRVGLAYGSALFLQGPGLALPLKYPYPEFNLYWRL